MTLQEAEIIATISSSIMCSKCISGVAFLLQSEFPEFDWQYNPVSMQILVRNKPNI